MPPITWDDANDRTLLLQLLALHPITVTMAEWELIAQKWDCGSKKDSFRKHFDKIKVEYVGEITAGDENKMENNVKSKGGPANGKIGLSNGQHNLIVGTKRKSSDEQSQRKSVKKPKEMKKEEVEDPEIIPLDEIIVKEGESKVKDEGS